MLKFITLPNELLPPAQHSHAVRAGDFLFITSPVTQAGVGGAIAEQTQQVMQNLKQVLDHAGASFDQVVMARLFLTDFRDYQAVNQVFSGYFSEGCRPSRTTVGVLGLASQRDIEIDLVVYCGDSSQPQQ